MHKLIQAFILIVLSATVIPLAISNSINNNRPDCYPIPSFLVEPAYAWSYYFNSTNHRWYNQTSQTVEAMIYDGYADGVSFNQDQVFNGNPSKGDIAYVENLDSNYNGKTITKISLVMKARISLDNGTLPHDIIRAGVFDRITGAMIQQFGNDKDPNDLLIRDNVIHRYNFTGSYTITNGNNVVVGMFVVYDNSGFTDNSDTWFNYNSYYYTSTNPSAKGSGIPSPFLDMNYKEFEGGAESLDDSSSDFAMQFFSETEDNTFTLIPLSGHSPNQTEIGRLQCQTQFDLLGIFIVLVIITVLLFLIHKKRKRN